MAAGEDVFLDPVDAGAVSVVALVGDGDDLEKREAIGGEEVFAGPEVVGEVAVAHGFEHFDGDDPVELAGEVSVVDELKGDAVVESFFPGALAGEVELFLGEGDGGDTAAGEANGLDGETSPAGTDFENVVMGGDAGFADDAVELVDLGLLKGLSGMVEESAGVHEGGIENEFKEVVGEVVVGLDVAAAVGAGVGSEKVAGPVEQAGEECSGEFAGVDAIAIGDEVGKEMGGVGGGPFAGGEGFAEADVAVEEDAGEEAGVADGEIGGGGCAGGSEGAGGVVGEGEGEVSLIEPVEAGEEEVHGPALEAGGRVGSKDGRTLGHGFRVKGLFLSEVEDGGLPVDAGHGQHSGDWINRNGPEQIFIGEGPGRTMPAGGEDDAVVLLDIDVDVDFGVGGGEVEEVVAGEVVEGGNMEVFGDLEAGGEAGAGRKRVGEGVEGAFAEGVVDFGEGGDDAVLVIISEVEADGVEDVVEVPGAGDEFDAVGGVDAVVGEVAEGVFADGSGAAFEEVAVMNGPRAFPVVAEEAEGLSEAGEFVEIEDEPAGGVTEGVVPGLDSSVHDPAMDDAGVHGGAQRDSASKSAATWSAERTASSWKP